VLIDIYGPCSEDGQVDCITDKAKQIIDKAIDEFGSKIYDYAIERYPVLTR